jgi:hypothetical protein
MMRATALLLLGSHGGLQVPGKVWDYVGARRPILTILGENDLELATLMRTFRRGPVVENDVAQIEGGLAEILTAVERDGDGGSYDLAHRSDCLWSKRGEDLAAVLSDVLAD